MTVLFAIVLTASVAAPAPPGRTVETVSSVDLNRYMGEWFEIARYPNRFQEKCSGDVRATYTRRGDGRVDVVNQCRTSDGRTSVARGVARIVNAKTNAQLKVRFAPATLSFLPFVWGDYWVIGLSDDYSWAVVGTPDRKYLWILARTPKMADSTFDEARSRATANGFDLTRLTRTRQQQA